MRKFAFASRLASLVLTAPRVSRLASLVLVLSLALSASAESYVGVNGLISLPQGGSEMRRLGGANVTAGTYLSDFWAVEGSAGVEEDFAALGVNLLGHWSGWSLYDRFFGYSAFDPFVTIGAKGWIGSGSGQVGPCVGLGAFYHFGDHWSLRAGADVTLGLDTETVPLYTLACGVQYAF